MHPTRALVAIALSLGCQQAPTTGSPHEALASPGSDAGHQAEHDANPIEDDHTFDISGLAFPGAEASSLPTCVDSDALWLDAEVAPDHGAVLETALVLEDGAPFDVTLTATWSEDDGSSGSLSRSFSGEDAYQAALWGLPTERAVTLSARWELAHSVRETFCSPEYTVTTGSVDTTGLPALQTITRVAGAEVDHVRFLAVLKTADSGQAVMVDSRGRYVWRHDLDNNELVKGLALDPDGERLYVLLPSDTIEEMATVRVLRPTGDMETITLDHALHHGMTMDAEGRLLGLGWELTEHEDMTLLTDTLVRFDLEAGTSEVLWRSMDYLGLPDAQQMSGLSGSGLYEGDVVAYGYANGVSVDRATGLIAVSLPGVDPGILTFDADGQLTSTFTNFSEAASVEGKDLLPGHSLFERPHHGWAMPNDRVLAFNRRSETDGSTLDAMSWTGDTLNILGSEALLSNDGEAIYNAHLGNVFPIDGLAEQRGGLVAAWAPNADHAYTLRTDPFDPEGTAGESELLLQVGEADDSTAVVVSGFMEAWSLSRLNGG